jgi:hypothetical protein
MMNILITCLLFLDASSQTFIQCVKKIWEKNAIEIMIIIVENIIH